MGSILAAITGFFKSLALALSLYQQNRAEGVGRVKATNESLKRTVERVKRAKNNDRPSSRDKSDILDRL